MPNGAAGINRCRAEWRQLVKVIKKTLDPLIRDDLLLADQLLEHGIITQAQCDSLHEAQSEYEKHQKGPEWEKEDDTVADEEREEPHRGDVVDCKFPCPYPSIGRR